MSSTEKGKIKLTRLSSPHPTPATSLKRMLCSAVLLHYQQADNLFDSPSRNNCDVLHMLPHSPFPISINSILVPNKVCASFIQLSFQQVKSRRNLLGHAGNCVKEKISQKCEKNIYKKKKERKKRKASSPVPTVLSSVIVIICGAIQRCPDVQARKECLAPLIYHQ